MHPAPLLVILMLLLSLAGCSTAPLLSGVSVDAATISPNGDGTADSTVIRYGVSRPSNVTITIRGNGREYAFRSNEPRSTGGYGAPFDGVVEAGDGTATRRVLPDGDYTVIVSAVDESGTTESSETRITLQNADKSPVQVQSLSASKTIISPNGDGDNDETVISYGITREAEVVIFVKDAAGTTFPLTVREKKPAALYSHYWNGTTNGRLVADGKYELHVQAFDAIGNVSEAITEIQVANGGKPDLRITRVEFSPLAVPIGGTINVAITVKNYGDVPLKTLGPPPGTAYRTDQTFNAFVDESGSPRYFSRPGVWRVAVSFDQAGGPYPFRWGLFADDTRMLMPGEEVTVTGTITPLARTNQQQFWASVEQSGIGFPGGEVGRKTIRVDY